MWPIASARLVDVTCLIAQQLNWLHTQLVCACIGHVHSMYAAADLRFNFRGCAMSRTREYKWNLGFGGGGLRPGS